MGECPKYQINFEMGNGIGIKQQNRKKSEYNISNESVLISIDS